MPASQTGRRALRSAARRLVRPRPAASARIPASLRVGGPARGQAWAAAAAAATPAGSTTASPPDAPPGRPAAGFAPHSATPCAGVRPRRSQRLRNGPARRGRCRHTAGASRGRARSAATASTGPSRRVAQAPGGSDWASDKSGPVAWTCGHRPAAAAGRSRVSRPRRERPVLGRCCSRGPSSNHRQPKLVQCGAWGHSHPLEHLRPVGGSPGPKPGLDRGSELP
jgi:hypothetical protein